MWHCSWCVSPKSRCTADSNFILPTASSILSKIIKIWEIWLNWNCIVLYELLTCTSPTLSNDLPLCWDLYWMIDLLFLYDDTWADNQNVWGRLQLCFEAYLTDFERNAISYGILPLWGYNIFIFLFLSNCTLAPIGNPIKKNICWHPGLLHFKRWREPPFPQNVFLIWCII